MAGEVGEIECQGRLVKGKLVKEAGTRKGGPRYRGPIKGFSKGSRRRLLDLCGRLDQRQIGRGKGQLYPAFLTLTYGESYPSGAESKRDLDSLLKWLKRREDGGCGIWRLEYQRRGAPHFHLILLGVKYIGKEDIQAAWSRIIKQEQAFTRIEGLRSARQAMGYVAKYVAKVADEGSGGFNLGTYPTGAGTGRFWGVWNRKALPFAPATKLVMSAKGFYALRRVAARARRWSQLKQFKSFRVYGDAGVWVRLAVSFGGVKVDHPLRM